MNVHPATPASKENRPARNTATRSGAAAYISERNTQAYLLARDTVRRVQRTASLIGEMSQRRAGAA